MTPRHRHCRVLVVDDNQQIRGLVHRALSEHGYQVDVAASLAGARQLGPGGYDALVIDARIGAERGADLIEELRAQDPAALGRCLLITGGSATGLPPDVGCLAKPFHLDDLLSAVQALTERRPAGGRPAPPGAATGARVPAGEAGPADEAVPAGYAGYELLGLLERLRAAERTAMADFVHEGPLQDLSAALLELQLAARDAPPALAGRMAGVARQVSQVARDLRRLVDREEPVAGCSLADAVHGQSSWLVPEPFTVRAPPAPLPAHGAWTALPAVAELALFLLAGDGRGGPAAVSVQFTGTELEIELSVPGVPGEPAAAGAVAAARLDLERLAAALGGTARTAVAAGGHQAWITLPAPGPGREMPRPEGPAPVTARGKNG